MVAEGELESPRESVLLNMRLSLNYIKIALFLFALYGRRWNEIRTLCWEDIDFQKEVYTIRKENK